MEIVGLDFETYFDKDYSLKKLSTTEYIRDPRFEVQALAYRTKRQRKARWVCGNKAAEILSSFDWSKTALLAHHAHFEGLILQHHFGIVPAFYYDTLSMARPLHGTDLGLGLDELARFYGGRGKTSDVLNQVKGVRLADIPPVLLKELGEYNAQDVDELWHIFNKMLPSFNDNELEIIDITIRAYADPVLQVDYALAKRELQREKSRRTRILNKIGKLYNLGKAPEVMELLRSRDRFAELLRQTGVEPPTKPSPRTGKPTYAFAKSDLEFIALESHPDPKVRELIEAKKISSSTIFTSRPAQLMSHGTPALPIYLKYWGGHTGRQSGGDKMNPQNFPRDSKLRNAILPPEGYKFVIIDSGQIEARVNAWLANETQLLEEFRELDKNPNAEEDVYTGFASDHIYSRRITKAMKKERSSGKICILGLGFQMGLPKFIFTCESGSLGPRVVLTQEQYRRAHSGYRDKYRNIVQQWYTFQEFLELMMLPSAKPISYGPLRFGYQHIQLPNGLPLRYPRLRGEDGEYFYKEATKIYGGKLVENAVQALARIVVFDQIRRLNRVHRATLLVHDEGVFVVPKKEVKSFVSTALEAFATPPAWAKGLPTVGEANVADYYMKG